MNYYKIKKASENIDWSAIESLEMTNRYLDTPEKLKAFAQICYNDEGIQVHLWAENDDVRAVEKGPLGAPYEDSCLEFFFAPEAGDVRYFNIEFNSNCCLYLGLGRCMEDHTRLIHDEGEQVLSPKASLTETGWEIFYTVPYKLIRRFFPDFEITNGKKIRANCFKCADLTTPANYISWSPVTPVPFSFHKPECFGEMEFEG